MFRLSAHMDLLWFLLDHVTHICLFVCLVYFHLHNKLEDNNNRKMNAGLILHGGTVLICLDAPWSLPWCPENALAVEIYNFIIGCPLPRRKCLKVPAPCPFKQSIQAWQRKLLFFVKESCYFLSK